MAEAESAATLDVMLPTEVPEMVGRASWRARDRNDSRNVYSMGLSLCLYYRSSSSRILRPVEQSREKSMYYRIAAVINAEEDICRRWLGKRVSG